MIQAALAAAKTIAPKILPAIGKALWGSKLAAAGTGLAVGTIVANRGSNARQQVSNYRQA